jgi:peptidyl-prolyl cis-trans isomerase SurA
VSDTQVAANNAPSDLRTMNPDGSIANPEQPDVAKPKTRLQDRAKLPKQKKDKGPKVDPFAPPPVTQDEVATQKQQATPLGLNGDTSKNKTPNSSKTGPKRRMTDEKKNGEEPATTATPGGDSGSPSATPAPAATPAPHN